MSSISIPDVVRKCSSRWGALVVAGFSTFSIHSCLFLLAAIYAPSTLKFALLKKSVAHILWSVNYFSSGRRVLEIQKLFSEKGAQSDIIGAI